MTHAAPVSSSTEAASSALRLASGWAGSDRPIFRPKNHRPPRDEEWEMKQAVIARDGLTTCFWCRQPFNSIEDATLEHILPLFDGGQHDLRNCTLACVACNGRNRPLKMLATQEERQKVKAERAAANRAANGGKEIEDCDNEIARRFPAVARTRGNKMLKHADASFLLKNIHRQLGRLPPSGHEKNVFKAHFNRWLNSQPNEK